MLETADGRRRCVVVVDRRSLKGRRGVMIYLVTVPGYVWVIA